MSVLIETERLYIRELLPTDIEGMFEMDRDPEVHKFIGNKPLTSIEQSRDTIEFVRRQYVDFGIGRWAVLELGTNEFVGWTGWKFMKGPLNGHTDFYDFGYRLTRKFWGKGYATESARAALSYGFETLHFNNAYAMTDVNNAASRKILEKIGFKYIETFKWTLEPTWRKEGEPTTWFKYFK